MLPIFDTATPSESLQDRLERAERVTPTLSLALAAGNTRLRSLGQQGRTGRLERLIADGAWTEMALELLSLGAPEWTLGRLCRIDGEWLCSLTRHPDVPDWLDDAIEVTHPSRELALLGAVHAALQRREASLAPHGRSVSDFGGPLDCSNYR